MALRRLLALAAAATVVADVVQVAVLCNYIEARIADRQDCDAIIAAVDAINDKTDGVLDGLLPATHLNLTVAFEGCGDNHPDTGLGDDAFDVADRPAMTHRADGRDVEEGRRVRRHEVFAPCEDVVLGQG